MIRKVLIETYKSGILLTISGSSMMTDSYWLWRLCGLFVLAVGLFTTDRYISETSIDTHEKRSE